MPARRKFEVRARLLTLEAMHHPLWVQLYNFQLSELIGPGIIIQTPGRMNAKILSGWHLTSLSTDVIPISLRTVKKNNKKKPHTVDKHYLERYSHILQTLYYSSLISEISILQRYIKQRNHKQSNTLYSKRKKGMSNQLCPPTRE